jgi:hypothetical protein
MTRRRHGTGAITFRNGRHLARLRVRGRLRSIGTFDTHEEAERVLSAAAAKLASPDYVTVGGSTLCEVGERCLDPIVIREALNPTPRPGKASRSGAVAREPLLRKPTGSAARVVRRTVDSPARYRVTGRRVAIRTAAARCGRFGPSGRGGSSLRPLGLGLNTALKASRSDRAN